jgi:hypothetical protein
LAAVVAIACAIEFAPKKPTNAAAPQSQPAAAQVQPPVTAPLEPTPAPSAVAQEAPAATSPQQAAAVKSPVRTAPGTSSPSPAVSTPTPQPTQQALAPPQATPVQQATAAPVAVPSQPQPQVAAPPNAAPAGPSRAEVLQAREHFAKLQVRAGSIRDSLASLKRSMQSQGMALNAKFTQPEGLMETYLRSADQALSQSDLAAAKEYGDKAEHQIEILEKLLNL